MRPLRFVALGDSLTEGVGDPVGEEWRGGPHCSRRGSPRRTHPWSSSTWR